MVTLTLQIVVVVVAVVVVVVAAAVGGSSQCSVFLLTSANICLVTTALFLDVAFFL